MNKQRARQLNTVQSVSGQCVVYWMSRDQRVHDNWSLVHAQELAMQYQVPLRILFVLQTSFLGATERQFDFMLRGLAEVEESLRDLNILFSIVMGEMVPSVLNFVREHKASSLVTDFSPLRIGRAWREQIASEITVPFFEVDAHNIVPAWVVSQKQEFAARTIRPKVHHHLSEFLDVYPNLIRHPYGEVSEKRIDWTSVRSRLSFSSSVAPVEWIIPGENASHQSLEVFISERLKNYDSDRNIPSIAGQSDLSPYFHFGQLSAQRVVLMLEENSHKEYGRSILEAVHPDKNGSAASDSYAAFVEELVVRRELSDNFCLYNPQYDSVEGFPSWGKSTLAAHAHDTREFLYSREVLEEGKTHDDAWNAAQLEMVKKGKMHGYMRMYWAKKILEWTENPEQAIEYAIYLNDRYELDGRDPNGYTGIAWSIGGVHDRPWFERPVFGTIRYMAYSGLSRKFNVSDYISYVRSL